ncbi:MAG TPA: transposase [Bryobacteraceae bacterium]|nr:transposase [Bryobacteraceae bacterium]
MELESMTGQPVLTGMVVMNKDRPLFEYAVLATSLPEGEVLTIAQMYRDRADCENVFDELKNQWAWTGFKTHNLRRSQLMARIAALVFNWWSLYVRLAVPGRHTEAIPSRPALVHGIAKQTKHGNQTKVTITSCHGKAEVIEAVLNKVNRFSTQFAASAQQLRRAERWAHLLRAIFREFYPRGPVAALPAPV